MKLWLKLIPAICSAMRSGKVTDGNHVFTRDFRVGLTELDYNRHMNHAMLVQSLEVVRFQMMIRTGVIGEIAKQRLIFPLRNIDVEFLRPLKLGQKYTVKAWIESVDDGAVVVGHSVESKGREILKARVNATLRKGREIVPLTQVAERAGLDLTAVESRKVGGSC